MESPCSSPENECEEPVRGAHCRREAGGVTQIFVEINEVNRFAAPQTGLAGKQRLRETGCRAGLRSDFTIKEGLARVQRKILIALITSAQTRIGPVSNSSRRLSLGGFPRSMTRPCR
jgi:hypothetical protein